MIVELYRAVSDDSSLIALTARADSLESLVEVFFNMDTERLFIQGDHFALALSHTAPGLP
jgi:hypothetical protein